MHVEAKPVVAASSAKRAQLRAMFVAAIAAVSYGLFARIAFGGWLKSVLPEHAGSVFGVMSCAFIILVPFSVGFIASRAAGLRNLFHAIAFAIPPALVALVLALALAWEGLICIALWLPLFVVLAALGGLAASVVLRLRDRRLRRTSMGAVLVLPFAVAPLEHAVEVMPDLRRVETQVVIDSDAATVWRNIAEVPQIQAEEHSFALSHLIGFPRPIAATSNGTGVGSVRSATFERGVLFVETVTVWRENEQLEFTIHADPDTIPSQALDEHVTVGGPYFDVLSGAYVIESLPEGGVILHLSSEHRLSTTFNAYASLWTDFVMRDTQQYILAIVKRRCEAARAR